MNIRKINGFTPPIQYKPLNTEKQSIPSDTVTISSPKEGANSISPKKRLSSIDTPNNRTMGEDPSIGVTASFGSTPGPIGVSLCSLDSIQNILRELHKKGISFYKKRKLHIPKLRDKIKELSSEKASKYIASGKEIDVRVPNSIMLPIKDMHDVKELSSFYILESGKGLPKESLSTFLTTIAQKGVTFKNEKGENIGIYGAYNYLTKSWDESSAKVNLFCDKIHLMTITQDNTSDISSLQKEYEKSEKAYTSIQKLLAKDKYTDYDILGKPISNTSLAQRFNIFKDLNKIITNDKSTLQAFSTISKYSNSAEELEKQKETFLNMHKILNDTPFSRSAFVDSTIYGFEFLNNEAKQEKASNFFMDFITLTKDAYASTTFTRILMKPSDKFTFEEKKDALYTLAREMGDEGIDAFYTIRKTLQEGESLKDNVERYLALFKKLSKSHDKRYARELASKGFIHWKENYLGRKKHGDVFLKFFVTTNITSDAEDLVKLSEAPMGDANFEERVNIIDAIAKKDRPSAIGRHIKYIESISKGRSLVDISKIYIDTINKLPYEVISIPSTSHLGMPTSRDLFEDTFKYALTHFSNNKEAFDTLIDILKYGASSNQTPVEIYEYIQKPISNEDYTTRKEAMLELLKLGKYGDVISIFETLKTKITPNKNIKDLVQDMKLLSKYVQEETKEVMSLPKLFGMYQDLRSISQEGDDIFKAFAHLTPLTKNQKKAMEIAGMLCNLKKDKIEDKLEFFKEIRESIKDGDPIKESTDTLKVIANTMQDSPLEDIKKDYKMLYDILDGGKNPNLVRDAIKFVGQEIQKGTLGIKSPHKAIQMLVKNLLISKDLEKAKQLLLFKTNQGKTNKDIQHEEKFVQIGKVKLKKRNLSQ